MTALFQASDLPYHLLKQGWARAISSCGGNYLEVEVTGHFFEARGLGAA